MADPQIRARLKSMPPEQVVNLVDGLVGIVLYEPELIDRVQANLSKAYPNCRDNIRQAIVWINDLADESFKNDTTLN